MNKVVLALMGTASIIIATPSSAQNADENYTGAAGMSHRIDQLESRLQAGIAAGTIDRTEARSLRRQIRDLDRLERRYSADGLTNDERRTLQQRIRATREQLRIADGGSSRYSAESDDEYYDRYAQRSTSATYREVNQVCGTSTGLSGIFGSLLRGGDCLSVGDRAPSGLGTLPTQYREQFRDNSDHYHRYVNGNVVEIDGRTGVVSRIFDLYQNASR